MSTAHSPPRDQRPTGTINGRDNLIAGSGPQSRDLSGNDAARDDNIAAVSSMKLPPFWKSDPELWFVQVDAQFNTKGIRRDTTKYYHLITALDADTLQQVSDIIRAPPDEDKYQTLKAHLITRFTESKERQLHRLLTDLELGDKKPSQLLREMRTLAAGSVPDDLLRSLWMKRMPANVRCILSASSALDPTVLADLADRILETSTASYVMAMNAGPERPSVDAVCKNSTSDRLEKLEKQIAELTSSIKKLSNKAPQVIRHRSRSRTKSPATRKQCYYHERFGRQAKKCIQPCNYRESTSQEN